MRNAILIHGKPDKEEYYSPNFPSSSNFHWFPWLQKQLLINAIPTQTPEMFNAWKPDYKIWSNEFEKYDINTDTLLVGHSCGAGFIIQWLSEHKDISVEKVVLVAPWLGSQENSNAEDSVINGFFDFEIDPKLLERITKISVFYSDNDEEDIHDAVKRIHEAVPLAKYKEFHNYGHFCVGDLGKEEFPELLEDILS